MSGSNRNSGGWITVTRRRKRTATKTPSSSNRRAQTAKNQKQFFPNWFDEAYPDELAMLGGVDASEHEAPKRRPQALDPADKVKVQTALVDVFRDGYRKHIKPDGTDAEILVFLDRFLQKHGICISGGFILKNIGAFAEGTGSSSIDVDIYIPSSKHVKEIHHTLQNLFDVDRKSDGKPVAKHFRVQTGSRSSKASFFAKNGIYSVTKYERNKPGPPYVQDGGGSSDKRQRTEERQRTAAQARWDAGVRAGSFLDSQRALDHGANPNEPIDGRHAIEVLFEAEHPSPTMLRLILEKVTTPPPSDLIRRIVELRQLPETEIVRMLQIAVNKGYDVNDGIPLESALLRNYASITRYLLESGAYVNAKNPSDPSKTIFEKAREGTYPREATDALMAYLEEPNSYYRIPEKANTFYKAFKATEDKRKRLLRLAHWRFGESGPACSTEGSYQHHGECWNDAAHMLFFYADGLKERTQGALLHGDLNALASRFKDGTVEGFAKAKRMRVYLEAAQSRLARQVVNQASTDETCQADMEMAITIGYGTHRARGTNAMVAAVMGAPPYDGHGTARPFQLGVADYKMGYFADRILADLITAFDLSALVSVSIVKFDRPADPVRIVEPIDTLAGIALSTYDSASAPIGHATCMYTCNGVDYFFDDNFGVFQYPWRKLLSMPDAELIVLSIEPADPANGSKHWPGVYIPAEKKLIVPSMESHTRFHVLNWERVWYLNNTWNIGRLTIKYVGGRVYRYTPVTFNGPRPVVPKKAPYVVGRGPFRAAYRPSDSSSERLALAGPRRLAEENIPKIKAEMDIVQAATKSSPVQIIRSFDLTFCQNWYDGEELWSMDREAVYKRAPGTLEDSYVPIYTAGNPVTRKRILKYMKRGFRVRYTDPTSGSLVEITRADLANVNTA
jgi:hypothetical protein